jgi:Flp pilus assembly protein TadG
VRSLISRSGRVQRSGPDAGVVTAETAVTLPMLLLVTWLVLAVLRLGDAQLSCQDAARAAARAAARGETASVVAETARAAAPEGAEVDVHDQSGLVVVEVRAAVRWAGPWGLPTFTVSGRAVAAPEGDQAAGS